MLYFIVSVVVIIAILAKVSEAEVTEPNPPTGSIDVLIVSGVVSCVSKAVLSGLRRHMANIGTVYFVVPTSFVTECRTMEDVVCHDESQILDWERSWVPGENRHGWSALPSRRGWYYQQLLKMLAFQRIPLAPDFVLWDADNVLFRDYAPFQGTQSRFLTCGDGMPTKGQYIEATNALIGESKTRRDVVVHQMPIQRPILESLVAHICSDLVSEDCARQILDSIPSTASPLVGFSEYHLYYTWFATHHPERVLLDHEKRLTRTSKRNWTEAQCVQALDKPFSANIFMVVLEQRSPEKPTASEAANKGDIKTIWQSNTPFPSTNSSKTCRWVEFQGAHRMCVHESPDTISDTIQDKGRWHDCDILDGLYNERPSPSKEDIYIDIGGNIGSCVFHMLHHTNTSIRVFEPNPDNLFCLTSTLLSLPSGTRDRVTVHPIALGASRSTTHLHVSKKNAGNGVVGHSIGRSHERFNDPIAIHIHRYSALVDTDTSVGLLKLDAQGFECNILRGMGKAIDRIKVIFTEIANLWLSGHDNCSDKIFFDLLQGDGKQLKDEHGTVLAEPKSGLFMYDVIATTRSPPLNPNEQRLFRTRPSVPECLNPKVLPDTSTSKMICLDHIVPGSCIVYSFGINYQWAFDDFMHNYGCVVRSFDPGMKYDSKRNTNHYFEPIGIGAETGQHTGDSTLYSKRSNYRVETVESIMQRWGDNRIDLLRIDAESAEYDVLDALPYDRIEQLSVEIHMWQNTLDDWVAKLTQIPLAHLQTYQNTDRVNKKTMTEIAPGVTRVYEMTFQRDKPHMTPTRKLKSG